jgi:hypothetical protein
MPNRFPSSFRANQQRRSVEFSILAIISRGRRMSFTAVILLR